MAHKKRRTIQVSEKELLYCVHDIPDSVFNHVSRIVKKGPINPAYFATIKILLTNAQMEDVWKKVNKVATRMHKTDRSKTVHQTTELIFSILLESFRKRTSGLNIKSGFRDDKYRKSMTSTMEKLHALLDGYPHNWELISTNIFVAKLSSILAQAKLEVSQFSPRMPARNAVFRRDFSQKKTGYKGIKGNYVDLVTAGLSKFSIEPMDGVVADVANLLFSDDDSGCMFASEDIRKRRKRKMRVSKKRQ